MNDAEYFKIVKAVPVGQPSKSEDGKGFEQDIALTLADGRIVPYKAHSKLKRDLPRSIKSFADGCEKEAHIVDGRMTGYRMVFSLR